MVELRRLLREQERELNKFSRRKIKVIERNGTKVCDMLTQSDPWGDIECGRPNCLPCLGTESDRGFCRTSNCVYETSCKLCKGVGTEAKYTRETSRTLFERMTEHVYDATSNKELSHISQHLATHHPEPNTKPHSREFAYTKPRT